MVDAAIPLTDIASALGVGDQNHVALVGGGGKTTLLHALGDRLAGRIVLTTTTKMGADEHRGRPVLIDPSDEEIVAATAAGPVVAFRRVEGGKAIGVDPARCDRWFELVDHVVIEADGSRGRPFKAPAEYEPVIPATTTLVVHVIGGDALGRVIADQCHRPLRVAALAGCRADQRLDPGLAAAVILHERGVRRSVPPDARFAVAITKVDQTTASLAGELAAELRGREPDLRIVAVAAHDHGSEGRTSLVPPHDSDAP